jgi:ASPIC and UnbV/FG-GAP-like repeat
LFRNHGGRHFVDITTSSGTGSLPKGHGIAFADINNDGHQEIFAELGGATQGDKYFSALFRNPGQHGNNWIALKLMGVKSNRAALGARIKLTIKSEDGERRYIHRHVTSGGSFGASPLRQHIGIGKATQVETLEVWWPTSKTRQIFHNLAPNQFIEIREFQGSFRKLEHRTFRI